MNGRLDVYLDRNDLSTMSHRHYVDRLASEYDDRPDVRTVQTISKTDVVHLNYLNPFGRVRHAKESLVRHFCDLVESVSRISKPVVLTEHGALQFSQRLDPRLAEYPELGEPGFPDKIKVAAQKLLANVADAIIAVSDWVAKALQHGGISASKVHTVHHGVSETFENREATAEDPFVFHLSKYSEQKNPRTILEVGRNLSVPLIVAGRRWDKNITDPPDGVEVRGYVSDEELLSLYNRASVFFFPSLYESFGLPIVESMACGTPVVGSNCGSVPEVIGEGGMTREPFDTAGFVDALERFVTEPEYRREYERRAVSRAEKFSWAATAEETIETYERAIERET